MTQYKLKLKHLVIFRPSSHTTFTNTYNIAMKLFSDTFLPQISTDKGKLFKRDLRLNLFSRIDFFYKMQNC